MRHKTITTLIALTLFFNISSAIATGKGAACCGENNCDPGLTCVGAAKSGKCDANSAACCNDNDCYNECDNPKPKRGICSGTQIPCIGDINCQFATPPKCIGDLPGMCTYGGWAICIFPNDCDHTCTGGTLGTCQEIEPVSD
jgi:hypothetical protein